MSISLKIPASKNGKNLSLELEFGKYYPVLTYKQLTIGIFDENNEIILLQDFNSKDAKEVIKETINVIKKCGVKLSNEGIEELRDWFQSCKTYEENQENTFQNDFLSR